MAVRALCVCNSGAVRSVTLARMLNKRGYEVLTCGVGDHHSSETVKMLAEWAHVIFVAEAKLIELLPISPWIRMKVSLKHMVGPDDWKVPHHPDLIRIYRMQMGEKYY